MSLLLDAGDAGALTCVVAVAVSAMMGVSGNCCFSTPSFL